MKTKKAETNNLCQKCGSALRICKRDVNQTKICYGFSSFYLYCFKCDEYFGEIKEKENE